MSLLRKRSMEQGPPSFWTVVLITIHRAGEADTVGEKRKFRLVTPKRRQLRAPSPWSEE